MSKIEFVARLRAAGPTGQACCPNCHLAVRLTDISIAANAEDGVSAEQVEEAVNAKLAAIRGAVRPALARPTFALAVRGNAFQAALLEELAAAVTVVCAEDGGAVDVPRLVARLKAGTVWS